VEKCGNIIAVGDTREEALSRANLGVKTVKITLGVEGELNEGAIRQEAIAKLSGVCSVCRICDGIECAGWLPGIGSCGDGEGFKKNLRVLKKQSIIPNVFSRIDNINTGSDMFGLPLDLPVLPSPISNMKRNMKGVFKDEEYNRLILLGAKKSGSIGCIGQTEYDALGEEIDYLIDPLSDVYGHGIPFFNPYHGMKTTLKNIEKAFRAGAKTAGLSLDHKDTPVNERWLPEMVGQSPLPIIAKGILSLENALFAVDAGVKGIVVSNRGGRILESLPSGFEVIEEIKREIKDSVLLMVDGGVRSGEDVFKALSLGVDLVLIGRPLFIFCAGGLENGVSFYINKIKSELKEVMLLAGAKTVGDITRSMTKQQ
jgi:hypothetical protein